MYLITFATVLCLNFVLNANAVVTEEEYHSMPELFYLDDFDYCMTLKESALYCSVTVQLAPIPSNNTKIWKIISEVISHPRNYRHDWLRHGICVPKFCPEISKNLSSYKNNEKLLRDAISKCYSNKYKKQGLEGFVTKMHCETDEPFYSLDIYDAIVGIFIALIVLTVALGTLYEGYTRLKTEKEYGKITKTPYSEILCCFSIIKNWERLITLNPNTETSALSCIGGFRFFSMVLVVFSHTCFLGFFIGIANPEFNENVTTQFLNMIVVNGSYIIQTFLVMSGWLLTYNFFVSFEEKKMVKVQQIVLAFVHRYIRLTPCLIVMLAIDATWLYHFGRGPFWDHLVGDNYRNCRMNWWSNILYINNYYDVEHLCMTQTWYLAADTQLFLVSLILVVIIWKYEHRIKLILSVCLLIGIMIPGVINYVNEYDMLVREYPEAIYKWFLAEPEWTVMFISGHTNFGGYFIGVAFGYIYYKYRGQNLFTKNIHVMTWWVLIWILPLGAIFSAYFIYNDDFVYSRIGAAIYVSLGRNVFAVGIALAIFGITQGLGWLMRECVVWPPIQILGRVTYCVYIVHYSIIRVRVAHSRTLPYISIYTLLMETIGDVCISYALGIILCLCVEMPTSALQKLMMPQMKKTKQEMPEKQPIDVAIINVKNEISRF